MLDQQTLLAYIGPETILPLSSVLAAIGGVFVMFWNSIKRGAMWFINLFRRKPALVSEAVDE